MHTATEVKECFKSTIPDIFSTLPTTRSCAPLLSLTTASHRLAHCVSLTRMQYDARSLNYPFILP